MSQILYLLANTMNSWVVVSVGSESQWKLSIGWRHSIALRLCILLDCIFIGCCILVQSIGIQKEQEDL